MENYEYISLPITLASNKLLRSLHRQVYPYNNLVCYSIVRDTMGFTTTYSPENEEYMCESEEEFHQKVSECKLMRLL